RLRPRKGPLDRSLRAQSRSDARVVGRAGRAEESQAVQDKMSKKRAAFLIILLLSLRAYTFSQVLTPDAIARFHINEANYLADVGKYLEAIEDLNTASGFAETAAIKAEAVSLKANLLSVFLDNPQTAMQAYDNVIRDFAATAYYEPAIFQAG